ncbi:MAG: alanine--tRNA ligase [Patescibacteria group bacterium]|jgi:alanyl-tRNA synthetase|nr:alanine--tRNA ligase [Patescibacteria group bacterium]
MTGKELREKYLAFFQSKGHTIIPSASLIPENDPTVLFTTAGMHPLVPYLLGETHPGGNRLTNFQKCIRTGDIDEVGDPWHLTFFEMLGNWSLGDYFKNEAINFSFEFLTKILNIPIEKLAVTCFAGEAENNIPKDEEASAIWQSLGIPQDRIAFLPRNDNWWGPAGQTGPCGPDTEMFYWASTEPAPVRFDPADKRWVEIWNDVFMQYNKTAEGRYLELTQKNVDTGMGLERTLAILNGKKSVYETELFKSIIGEINKLATAENIKSIRIIADHLRTATFILGDHKGIAPSNLDQGYVLRRLIRRAIRHGKIIGINKSFTFMIAKIIINNYADIYPELSKNQKFIEEQLNKEEEKFTQTLEKGLKEFSKISNHDISGYDAFILFSSYGFPLEMTKELAAEKGITVDETGFNQEFSKHQALSRAGAEQKFKGGLADHSTEATKFHTATHLLLASLRKILGDHIYQKGSNITAQRLRFDFSHPDKLTSEQIKQVEDLVNEQITNKLPVTTQEMTVEEAKQHGAMGIFEHKYADRVKVYSIGDFSKEICGGPHVKNTGELGHFKIKKEESSSSGIRRIKAILE